MNEFNRRKSVKRVSRRRRQRQKYIALAVLAALILILVIMLGFLIKLLKGNNKETNTKTTKATVVTTKATSSEKTTQSTTEKTTEEATTKAASKFDHSAWYLTLVNATHKLDATPNIELETLKNGHKCDKRISDDLQAMFDDCRAAGLNPLICSSFRTHERQIELYNKEIAAYKAKGYDDAEATRLAGTNTAVPGTSEHELGLSLDIVATSYQLLNDEQENTAEQKWLMENCYKYGFILRYPKDKQDVTGIMYEPWHYRYVGKEAAKIIWEEKICLEEFLEKY